MLPPLPPCPFHRLTGLYCPGCGNARALHALLRGDLAASVAFNPLFIPALLWLAAALIAPKRILRPGPVKRVLLALALFTLLRNIPLHPFTLLAP